MFFLQSSSLENNREYKILYIYIYIWYTCNIIQKNIYAFFFFCGCVFCKHIFYQQEIETVKCNELWDSESSSCKINTSWKNSYMWENILIFPRKSNGIRESSPEFINKGFMDLGKSWAMKSESTIVEHVTMQIWNLNGIQNIILNLSRYGTTITNCQSCKNFQHHFTNPGNYHSKCSQSKRERQIP